jgi:hypothetical protein
MEQTALRRNKHAGDLNQRTASNKEAARPIARPSLYKCNWNGYTRRAATCRPGGTESHFRHTGWVPTIYNPASYRDEKKAALTLWAQHIDQLKRSGKH